MAGKARYLMIASMDVDPEHEAIFNEVYDKEHVPNLCKVSGVLGVTRCKRETLTMNIGGERKTIEIPNEPTYTAIYELESPDVLTSPAWDRAIEDGLRESRKFKRDNDAYLEALNQGDEF